MTMRITKTFAILFSAVLLISCNEDSVEDYEGRYSGEFNGSKSGTWKVLIEEDGSARGVLDLDDQEKNVAIRGSVNKDGELTVMSSATGREFVFDAFISDDEDVSGDWRSIEGENFSGTWKGEKVSGEEWFPWHFLI